MLVWIDNQIYDAESAPSNALSASNLSGWGAFSTLGIQNARPLWLPRHCARLRRDGAQLNLTCRFDDTTIERACNEITRANQIENGIARLTLYGSGDDRWHPNTGASLLISAIESQPAPSEIKLWFSPHRISADRPLCGVKSTSYAAWQWLWQRAQERGCDEAIYCDSDGNLCEGARSNLFWIKDGELFTPALSCGPLPGIGRALIIEIAQRENLTVREITVPSEKLIEADEIFVINAVTGPRRVVSLINDESEIYRAQQNEFVRRLQELWHAEVAKEIKRQEKTINANF